MLFMSTMPFASFFMLFRLLPITPPLPRVASEDIPRISYFGSLRSRKIEVHGDKGLVRGRWHRHSDPQRMLDKRRPRGVLGKTQEAGPRTEMLGWTRSTREQRTR